MVHPVIPQVIELAAPVASGLELEVVNVLFYTNQSPPVLRIDVRNLQQDTSLDDCEQMSRALEARLDETDLIPGAYVLEVSSPGTSRILASDREFIAFRGFEVMISMSEPIDGKDEWVGRLGERTEAFVTLSLKGRTVKLPRAQVYRVQLYDR